MPRISGVYTRARIVGSDPELVNTISGRRSERDVAIGLNVGAKYGFLVMRRVGLPH